MHVYYMFTITQLLNNEEASVESNILNPADHSNCEIVEMYKMYDKMYA